MFLGLLESEYS